METIDIAKYLNTGRKRDKPPIYDELEAIELSNWKN